jgi:uncharacterized protein YkwD
MIRAAGLWLLLATAVLAAPDWYQGTPEEFARRPEAQARIDPAHFNEELMTAAIFHETNRTRRRLGLPVFTHVAKLDTAADLKAALGVLEAGLTHESAPAHLATPAIRVKYAGLDYSMVAENLARLPSYDLPAGTKQVGVRQRDGREIYYRLDTGRDLELRTYADFAAFAVESWMNSPGHRANIVNPGLKSLGCAARPCHAPISDHEQIYAVQVFYIPPH